MMQTTLQASALIVLVLVLRRLLRGKVSQRAVYLLWLPVLMRLALPGVLIRVPRNSAVQASVQKTAETLQLAAENLTMEPVRLSGIAEAADTVQYISMDWQSAFVTVWNIGTVALLLWAAAVNLRFSRKLRKNRIPLPLCGKLPVYKVPGLTSPCLTLVGGRQGIYIPDGFTDDPEQLRHILAHETAHSRQLDPLWELSRLVLTALYWWNPLVWLASSLSRQDGELACDEAALKALGESERFSYGRTLLQLAERGAHQRSVLCTAPMSTGGRALRERIQQLSNLPNRSKSAALLTVLLLVLATSAAFVGVTAANYPSGSNDPFANAVTYTKIKNKPAKVQFLDTFSFQSNSTGRRDIAQQCFDVYADNLQTQWAAFGYPLKEVVLFDLNVSKPDEAAEDTVELTPVYAIQLKSEPSAPAQDFFALLEGYERGRGALEGYWVTADVLSVSRQIDGYWSSEQTNQTVSLLNHGYRPLTLEEVCEFVSLKGASVCFEDFTVYQSGEGNDYFSAYKLSDAPCTLYTARRNETDPGLYLVLYNRETGASADLREGLAAVCKVAGIAPQTVLTQKDIDAAAAVVKEFIASHPVWQDAELRYDPYQSALHRDSQLGVYSIGYTRENVPILLCDFTAGEGPVLTQGQRYTNYMFILGRHSEEEPWEVLDQGY